MAEQRSGGNNSGRRGSGGGRPGGGSSRGGGRSGGPGGRRSGGGRSGSDWGGDRSGGRDRNGGGRGRSSDGSSRGSGGRGPSGRPGNGKGRPGRRPAEPRGGRVQDSSSRKGAPPTHGGKYGRRQFDVDAVDRYADGDVDSDEVVIERVDSEPRRSSSQKRKERNVAPEIEAVHFGSVAPDTRRKLQGRLASAADDFQRERFSEAKQKLASIDKLAPDVPEVLELRGLCKYRLGDWKGASADLERFRLLTGSVEQHPVLADAHRALGHHALVAELWSELGEYSPEPGLLEEGRIVAAGSLADQGRLQDAIRMLEKAPKPGRRPGVHHLRRWYALADLYERAGDVVTARRRFTAIAEQDPSFGDAAERAANLG